jgi:cytochrome P450
MSDTKTVPEMGLINLLIKYYGIHKDVARGFHKLLSDNDGLVKIKAPANLLFTNRPEFVKHVFKTNQKNYIIGKALREKLPEDIGGNGLISLTGKPWLKERRAIQPGFHKKRLEAITNTMATEIDRLMKERLDKYTETQEEIDLFGEMLMLTFKLTIKSLFGTTKFPDEKANAFRNSIASNLAYLARRVLMPFLEPWNAISGARKKNRELSDVRSKHLLEYVQERKESGLKGNDLLDLLLDVRYEDGSSMTDKQVVDELAVLFGAGHETTGIAASWTLFTLASYPEIVEKILEDVEKHVGDGIPTLDDLFKMEYVTKVVDEGLRHRSPSWYLEREALEDDVIDGVQIKKGDNLAFCIYSLHRNPEVWENPEVFDPERFSAENKEKNNPHGYLPFGGGRRLCIGKNIALMKLKLLLVMLLRRYKIKLVTKEVRYRFSMTLNPGNKVWVKLEKRQKS